jgi:hypothetical protein
MFHSGKVFSITVMKDNRIDSPSYIQPIFPKVHAMKNQAANFIKAVRGEKEAPCTAGEAVKDLVSAREYILLLEK